MDVCIKYEILIKCGVEHYSNTDPDMTEFFFTKLQELLMNGLDISKLDPKINSKNRLSLKFLKNIGKIKIKNINFKDMVKKHCYNVDKSSKIMNDELDLQKLMLYEKMKGKRSLAKKRRSSMRPNVNQIIESFIKLFHMTYIAKLFPQTMEIALESQIQNYLKQIDITSHYDDKIKEFEMLQMIDEGIKF